MNELDTELDADFANFAKLADGKKPAVTLEEMRDKADLRPLREGDLRYVDMASSRGTRELERLRQYLLMQDANQNKYAKVAFVGHRGSGKSTELARIKHDLAERFTAIYMGVDTALRSDCDYTDLMLWMLSSLIEYFEKEKITLKEIYISNVAEWFAETTIERKEEFRKEVEAEVKLSANAKLGMLGTSLAILARIKARIVGSEQERLTIRRKLQNNGTALIKNFNTLLDHAQNMLVEHGKSPDLLIIQDDIDKIEFAQVRRFINDYGDLLLQLRVHLIVTAPIALALAPNMIAQVFPVTFTMPMPKVRNHDGSVHNSGIDALVHVIALRVDIASLFDSPETARLLAEESGGSVRDMIRLLITAQLEALVDKKQMIDGESVASAIKILRTEYERNLQPSEKYFPTLAKIHSTKQLPDIREGDPIIFYMNLLYNAIIFEYNGELNWYDVHPIVRRIKAFRDAAG